MPEQTHRTLSHFSLYQFNQPYYTLPPNDRKATLSAFQAAVSGPAQKTEIYQVSPLHAEADILVWSAIEIQEAYQPEQFFTQMAQHTNPIRQYIRPVQALWGFTRPSEYTKTRSTQEIDPFASERKSYLVMYPFVKTTEWYLMSREARQGMMNEHIRIGHEYADVRQILLYATGLDDQAEAAIPRAADARDVPPRVRGVAPRSCRTDGRKSRASPRHSEICTGTILRADNRSARFCPHRWRPCRTPAPGH